ncbi:MAG: pyrroline-5-carboxylate reductase [Ancrocorticia sp.]|jgi:pyrroline-5-carboxylate reductase|nr:pyrroline-5-carboxylate reductase [Ancrocorticia sp.]MCI1895426.1 pyrroline-5-carboxylate reductase [Ancrocorticia sp.]MCI1932993.1 pyrroline-5-carboxylate reductase [Ancrocorticia sp.]MCI1963328.1 pyrroline-5-carboxylate reductase [Ancrocorticia sp.]MCI2002823.1 pyrroline-5-carboxylate reductase [Ancrocorticia sp.]
MIGFIGAGAMGSAIIRGAIASGTYKAAEIVLTASTPEHAQTYASELGTEYANTAADVVRRCGKDAIIVIAVKPYAVPTVLHEIRAVAAEQEAVLLSIAAGTTLDSLAIHLNPGQPIVRAMPNVAASIRQSITALCPGADVTDSQASEAERLLSSVGQVIRIAEKDFPTFSALAGCSPAFTLTYIDAMARAGVKNGLSKKTAVRIAAQAVLGTALLSLDAVDEPAGSPMDLADAVQSPGGTTVAGIIALEDAGFGAAVVRGVQAAIDRDIELQQS